MLLRCGVLVLGLMPAQAALRSGWSAHVGSNPRYADGDGPLGLHVVIDGMTNLSPAALALAGVGVVGFWLFDQLLIASAFRLLAASPAEPPRLWRRLWSDGWSRLLPYLRVALVAALFAGLGVAIIGKVFERVDVAWQAQGATGEARIVLLNLWRAAVTVAWLSLVGAFAFWCRALLALDERVRVRRVILEVMRLSLRAPLASLFLYLVVACSLQLMGPFLLLRTGAPEGGLLDPLLWLVYVVAQVYAWHFLVHAATRLYASSRFEDIRQRGDVPLGWWVRLRRKKAAAVASTTDEV
jgi:hypothetical protein